MDNRTTTFIVDDEPRAIESLRRQVEMRDDLYLVGTATDPYEAVTEIERVDAELVFVDMKMEGMSGLELIKVLGPERTYICYTAYNEYGPHLSPLDVPYYLLKPTKKELFDTIVDLCLRNMYIKEQGKNAIADKELLKEGQLLVHVLNKNEDRSLRLEDIWALRGKGDDTWIYYLEECIIGAGRLRLYEQRLPKSLFVRTHRSYLVNRTCVLSYSRPNRLRLQQSGLLDYVRLSERYKHKLLKELDLKDKKNDKKGKPTY
ncbi:MULTISPECIES: LytR/AlgR family response regulator transcription factor [Sphingobacterium]|uniref:LytR/AlgR family response regulator transcription factor n=1 Tax=Sphingobacterium TaxID=28453 RepID=UPI0013DA14BE|nr:MULTISPECIES: LytTR family DNA-binding domain-containing protein [unclassified Sphingobacterium]